MLIIKVFFCSQLSYAIELYKLKSIIKLIIKYIMQISFHETIKSFVFKVFESLYFHQFFRGQKNLNWWLHKSIRVHTHSLGLRWILLSSLSQSVISLDPKGKFWSKSKDWKWTLQVSNIFKAWYNIDNHRTYLF